MKKVLPLLLVIMLFFLEANAQKKVFTHDSAGNRIKRNTGRIYNYYDFNSMYNFEYSCRCIITTTPSLANPYSIFWFHILSIDGLLAFDFMDPLNAPASSSGGTVTIRHLTDPNKFQKYSINGQTSQSYNGFNRFGSANLIELGSTPIANGDIVYLSFTVN